MPINMMDVVMDQPSFTNLIKPTPHDSSGVKEIEHSEIRKIANDVLGAVKYSFANTDKADDISKLK